MAMEGKAPVSWQGYFPYAQSANTQAALHCWFNTPNTQMLKSQIVIWSSVHVLSSVQTSILLCLPTQKQGKWVPKFKHLLQMKPRRVSPSQWLAQSLKSQVTHQPFRLHLLTPCNLFTPQVTHSQVTSNQKLAPQKSQANMQVGR